MSKEDNTMAQATATPAKKAAKKAPAKKAATPVKYTRSAAAPVKAEPAKKVEPVKAAPTTEAPKAEAPKVEAPKVPATPAPPKEPAWTPNAISATYGEMAEALKLAMATINTRPSLPILSAVIFGRNRNGDVVMRSTDLEVFTESALTTGYMDAGGEILINARTLHSTLAGVRGRLSAAQAHQERVDLVRGKDGRVSVVAFNRTLELDIEASYHPEDLIKWPEGGGTAWASMEASALIEAFTWAGRAAGADDTLPMLTGVRIEADAATKQITCVATDRYRLSIAEVPGAILHSLMDRAVLIPARHAKVFKDLRGFVELALQVSGKDETSHLVVRGKRLTVHVRPLDATFPAYRSLIPTAENTWTIEKNELLGDVIAASSVAGRNAPVHVDFAAGKYQVHGCQPHVVPSSPKASSWTAGFNPQFMVEGLAGFTSDDIVIAGTSANKPFLLTGYLNHQRCTYLLMPVRLPG